MPVSVYRVVGSDGWTVQEYVAGRGDEARVRALRHAARIAGRVFHIDEHGFLRLIWKGDR